MTISNIIGRYTSIVVGMVGIPTYFILPCMYHGQEKKQAKCGLAMFIIYYIIYYSVDRANVFRGGCISLV